MVHGRCTEGVRRWSTVYGRCTAVYSTVYHGRCTAVYGRCTVYGGCTPSLVPAPVSYTLLVSSAGLRLVLPSQSRLTLAHRPGYHLLCCSTTAPPPRPQVLAEVWQTSANRACSSYLIDWSP